MVNQTKNEKMKKKIHGQARQAHPQLAAAATVAHVCSAYPRSSWGVATRCWGASSVVEEPWICLIRCKEAPSPSIPL